MPGSEEHDPRKEIFRPFFTTKGSPSQGTGLGLAVVLRFIKEARGVLHVHTQTGQGTAFTVYLPATALGK
jgi:two-component system cell cycle sensor histidine kinase/response regulator CckA